MKAVQIAKYGGPEVLEINNVARPDPGPEEVLVSIAASSVNGHDVLLRSGGLKLMTGRKFPMGTGLDFAGTVAAIGAGVTQWKVGDAVWGLVPARKRHLIGSAAEYVTVGSGQIGLSPTALSPVEAAALVVTGSTALTAVTDATRVAPGGRVLVRGAAGGVGAAAVQLAVALGSRVSALARGRDADFLTHLGAEQVLDSADTDPQRIGPFDAIVDTVGSDLSQYRRRLTPGGRMVTVAIGPTSLRAIAKSSVFGPRRIRTFADDPDTTALDKLAGYVASGNLRPTIDQVWPLNDAASAHRAFSEGGHRGKQILDLSI